MHMHPMRLSVRFEAALMLQYSFRYSDALLLVRQMTQCLLVRPAVQCLCYILQSPHIPARICVLRVRIDRCLVTRDIACSCSLLVLMSCSMLCCCRQQHECLRLEVEDSFCFICNVCREC